GRLLGVRLEVVHAADAVEDVEAQPGVVAQEAADLRQVRRRHDHERVEGLEVLGLDAVAELLLEDRDDFRGGHGGSGGQALAGVASSLFFLAKALAFSIVLSSSGSSV